MTYEETIEFLEKSYWMGSRLGLERVKELLRLLGDPQKNLKVVHVTGTNGKGSTCAMVESVLRAAGYKTGLYTSPHLSRYNERIRINGQDISDADMCLAAEKIASCIEKMEDHPTIFERITAMAFLCFVMKGCQVVVLEVGLGGRLDATNVVDSPLCSVIANIDLDHTGVLGNTIASIAGEKAGIIKKGRPVVLSAQSREAEEVVEERCRELGCSLQNTDPEQFRLKDCGLQGQTFDYRNRRDLKISLPGTYQLCNARLALDTVDVLINEGLRIPEEAVYRGMEEARWPGRFEVLKDRPLVIVDGAHNPNGADELAKCLKLYLPGKKLKLLMGVLADKDYRHMLNSVLPFGSSVITVTPPSERSLPAEELAEIISEEYGIPAKAASSVEEGLDMLMESLKEGDAACIFGSLYQTGIVREYFEKFKDA